MHNRLSSALPALIFVDLHKNPSWGYGTLSPIPGSSEKGDGLGHPNCHFLRQEHLNTKSTVEGFTLSHHSSIYCIKYPNKAYFSHWRWFWKPVIGCLGKSRRIDKPVIILRKRLIRLIREPALDAIKRQGTQGSLLGTPGPWPLYPSDCRSGSSNPNLVFCPNTEKGSVFSAKTALLRSLSQ